MRHFLTLPLRHWRKSLAIACLLLALLCMKAWHDTMGDPAVLRATVTLPSMAPDAAPVTAVLISDIHVARPDMPPERLERIVAQINALNPDIVLIAGDLVSEKGFASHIYTPEEVVAPLGKLAAPLGVVVAPGNHDHWFDWPGLSQELARHSIVMLQNAAVQIGPLAIGGVDDDFTGRADLPATLGAMEPLAGGRLILTHSPDIAPDLPADVTLLLAGHTHCGQIAWPWGGAPTTLSRYGNRYGCGLMEEEGRTVIVGAGLGTSVLPLRLFTQPEIWLIELRPE